MKICGDESLLVVGIRELEYGELRPNEVVPGHEMIETHLPLQMVRLIQMVRNLGTPRLIKVADGLPTYGEFEILTRAGPGSKRVNFA